eukprot:SAG11_NODE_1480_length_4835_cov_3.840794_3_plen_77_part_00
MSQPGLFYAKLRAVPAGGLHQQPGGRDERKSISVKILHTGRYNSTTGATVLMFGTIRVLGYVYRALYIQPEVPYDR